MDLETSISLRDGVLIETVNFLATGPIDLRVASPWMYAWTKDATAFVFGDDKGIQKRGLFRKEGLTVSEVIKNSTWMAVFNPVSGQGAICCFLKQPPTADGWFLLIDAPGVYRKVAAYTLEDKVVEAGFKGTYQSAVGFFTATENDWEQHALRRATELRTSAIQP